jgi:hypothetical protein
MIRTLVLSCIVLVAACSVQSTRTAHALYRDGSSLWPNGQVRVCWEAGKATDGTGNDEPVRNHPNFANLSRAIRGAVSAWSTIAHIDFVGWGDCSLNPHSTGFSGGVCEARTEGPLRQGSAD